ncbi:MAG: type II toxin-antitoxin system VapB family antitoxin [Chloroflexi bacterium]|nr:type II toxin-antitoxin system VapB family antitoxin [Chloroflexota bacterium]
MSLNIKNEETCALARELAELTGETMTGAITLALQERLERERRERSVDARLDAIHEIQERVARLLDGASPPIDHAELLYDERGLPK